MDNEIPLTTIKFACEAKLLRSLFLGDRSGKYAREFIIEKSGICSISNLMYLRALDLSGSNMEEVPNDIGKLKHLRFLDLSDTRIQVLPNSMTSLYNLQTLRLTNCQELTELPEDTRNMSNLRHLDIKKCDKLTRMPCGLGRLRSLQTLPLFTIGEEPGCTIMELQHLNLIRGELRIQNLNNVKDPIEAVEARLSMKTNLQRLELSWENDFGADLQNVDVDVLENLQPQANIRSLTIENYSGNRLASWLTGIDPSSPFSCLTELSLFNLKKCESLGSLGQLQSLKHLCIWGMDGIRSIGREFYYRDDTYNNNARGGGGSAFPSLTSLLLYDMPNLEQWLVPEGEAAAFPCLEELSLMGCPKLVVQPRLPSSVVKLIIQSCSEELLGGGSLQGLSRLRGLSIRLMEASKSGWEGLQHLTALQELEVWYCENLTCLPEGIMALPCLQSLILCWNNGLESLISRRRVGGGGEVENELPPLFSNTIHHLGIQNNAALTALPEWLGCLTSLRSLTLGGCAELAVLPDGMKHLTSLQELEIEACPMLEGRCERERGEDWHKIAHIPTVKVRLD